MQLRGQVALVTGASSGIGRETALRLAAEGAHVLAAGRDPERTDATATATGGTPLLADLVDGTAVDELVERALAVHGRVDVLVAAAGSGWAGEFVTMEPARIEELVAADLLAPVRLSRLLLPGMLARGAGHLALVGSVAGATGVAGEAVYAAAKAGLDGFAESLAQELTGSGVGVSLTVPGAVRTAFFDNRGRPYARRHPAPVAPGAVAEALLDAVRNDRAQAWVPRWLRVALVVRALAPRSFRRLSVRFGEQVRSRTDKEVGNP